MEGSAASETAASPAAGASASASAPALPAAKSASGRGVGSIERAVDVMFTLARSGVPRGVTDIASHLGMSKAAVHRILTSLRKSGLVVLDARSKHYSLGPSVLELAASYRSGLDVRSLAIDTMRELVEATQETATLSILVDGRRIYVEQFTPNREVRMTVQVGSSFPLHAGASSKAFLAWLPEDERRRILASPLERLTEATVVDAQELDRELALVRERGFAVSEEERQPGAASVAAPLLDESLQPVAVLSVCGPLQRFKAETDAAAAELVSATRALSRKLGAVLE